MPATISIPTSRADTLQDTSGVSDGQTPGRSGSKDTPSKTAAKPCCEKPEIVEDGGSLVCVNCATVIRESNIVSEVTFGENSAGAAVVQGAFVGEGQRYASTMGAAPGKAGGFGGRESREVTEAKGREEIRRLASACGIAEGVESQAFQCYKLAIGSQFTQGRRTKAVAASCLYLACRRDPANTTLLMDLAEKIQVNVFKLGSVYKALLKELWLDDPSTSGKTACIDVEPLILKFARKLEFGSMTNIVAQDAVRILQRMKRDWMVTGRQPAGLCGACIILAARMNNFRRTIREVVFVVKVADATVNSRLQEFRRTTSAALTIDQFRSFGHKIKRQHDPPAVYNARLKEEKAGRDRKRMSGLGEYPESDNRTDATPGASPSRQLATPASSQDPEQASHVRDADGFLIPNTPKLCRKRKASSQSPTSKRRRSDNTTPTRDALDNDAQAFPSPSVSDSSPKTKSGLKKKTKRVAPPPPTADDLAIEEDLEIEINTLIRDPVATAAAAAQSLAASAERATALAETKRGISSVSDAIEIGLDEFEDDDEVACCLLSDAERAIKERIWVTNNEDWLRVQQAKMLKRSLDEASGLASATDPDATTAEDGTRRKKRKSRGKMGDGSLLASGPPVKSPAEAVQRMLEKRASAGFSKFINYEKLVEIYGSEHTPPVASARASPARSESTEPPPADTGAGAPAPRGLRSRAAANAHAATDAVPAGSGEEEEILGEISDDDDEDDEVGSRRLPIDADLDDDDDDDDDEEEEEDVDVDTDDEEMRTAARMGIDTGITGSGSGRRGGGRAGGEFGMYADEDDF